MIAYIARRIVFAVVLIFAVSSASLVLARLAPGDFVSEQLGVTASRAQMDAARAKYGLNRSVAEQYSAWLAGALKLDFGRSMQYDRPVLEIIPARAVNTGLLALTALAVATLIGLPLGIVTGTRRGGAFPAAIRGVSLILLSLPPLLTSLFLVFLAAKSGLLPVGGMTSPGGRDILRHMIVPVAALALPLAAMFERLQAQAMRETVEQPYVLATFARGVPLGRVIWRDALKNGLRPVASIYGLVVGTLLSGSFAVEVVTAWPGLGQLMLSALRARDVYLVAGCAAAGSIFLALGTLVSDAMLAFVDPRTISQ